MLYLASLLRPLEIPFVTVINVHLDEWAADPQQVLLAINLNYVAESIAHGSSILPELPNKQPVESISFKVNLLNSYEISPSHLSLVPAEMQKRLKLTGRSLSQSMCYE